MPDSAGMTKQFSVPARRQVRWLVESRIWPFLKVDREDVGVISGDESSLPGTEVHYLRSEHVGDEFKIFVGHCLSPESAAMPVVYVGDPSFIFGTAVDMVLGLNLHERLPTALIVGVGYRATDIDEVINLRCRDFTPTVASSAPEQSAYPAMMGGASRFLAFIRDELKPRVAERYDVDPADSTFFGNALGGLFASYVLFNQPDTFRRYGIGSPSLDWDNELMFKHETEYAQAHHDLPAKVFVSVGAYENLAGWKHFLAQLPPDERAKAAAEWDDDDPLMDCVAPTERMVAALRGRAYPSLKIECEVLPGEYHETAPPLNLSRSLRYLFDVPR